MPRPKMSELSRQARFIYRVEAGKRCKQCYEQCSYDAFNRDSRRIDNSASTCKACKRILRLLKRQGLTRHWQAIRLLSRQAASLKQYPTALKNDAPTRDVILGSAGIKHGTTLA